MFVQITVSYIGWGRLRTPSVKSLGGLNASQSSTSISNIVLAFNTPTPKHSRYPTRVSAMSVVKSGFRPILRWTSWSSKHATPSPPRFWPGAKRHSARDKNDLKAKRKTCMCKYGYKYTHTQCYNFLSTVVKVNRDNCELTFNIMIFWNIICTSIMIFWDFEGTRILRLFDVHNMKIYYLILY